ncbi:phage tail protein, partial [Propionivibrio sp.]|uniref:phage tail protein n=1 Tax=Propionivibrio sp. TaxID=2212460 RepID=UPI0025F9C79D
NSREMELVLPRRVTLDYLDIWRAYDNGSQYAERLNTPAVNVLAISLAIVLNASEAAGIAETLLYLYWLERYDVTFSLPPTRSALEPGDIIVVVAVLGDIRTPALTAITYYRRRPAGTASATTRRRSMLQRHWAKKGRQPNRG